MKPLFIKSIFKNILILDNEDKNRYINLRRQQVAENRGLQEPIEWYDKCRVRERNGGKLL